MNCVGREYSRGVELQLVRGQTIRVRCNAEQGDRSVPIERSHKNTLLPKNADQSLYLPISRYMSKACGSYKRTRLLIYQKTNKNDRGEAVDRGASGGSVQWMILL